MGWEAIDWQALERLRGGFLQNAKRPDYWQSENDLASYDQTFAQRIGWKWDYVFAELTRRGWTPPTGDIVDWGCGTGVAGRVFLDHFGVPNASKLLLWDRSPLAMSFAQRRARERFPGLIAEALSAGDLQPGVVLLSHVLTELDQQDIEPVIELVTKAKAVLWVEPGSHEVSRKLSALRDRLREHFHTVAPCTHQAGCPMLAPENQRHWCHHFASPPPSVFTDSNWGRFAALAGIDLRSLPLSFLVLDKRPMPTVTLEAVRVIGRPRCYKAHALLLGCQSTGLHDRRLSKRRLPEPFRQIKKGHIDPLQLWRCEEEEIVQLSKFC
jgi:hypothetical protein